MKKWLLGLLLSTVTVTAAAWEYDMAEVTCGDIQEDKELAAIMLFWLDGYVSAEQDATLISEAWLEELGAALQEGCQGEKNRNLLDIVRKKILE